MNEQIWSASGYEQHLRYVSHYGMDILEWLEPKTDEYILDIGCGDGTLTREISQSGAHVTGIDTSESLLTVARQKISNVRLCDAQNLDYDNQFDAVFSNAALHWMRDAKAVLTGVHKGLKKQGRFVAEFGGHGNIAAIMTALRAMTNKYKKDPNIADMFFFPSEQEYIHMLETAGFIVERSQIYVRQTPIKSGMKNVLIELMGGFFNAFSQDIRNNVIDDVVTLLKPSLCDSQGNWVADYVRLRIKAIAKKP